MHLIVIERINIASLSIRMRLAKYKLLDVTVYIPFVRDMNYVCEKQMQLTLLKLCLSVCVRMFCAQNVDELTIRVFAIVMNSKSLWHYHIIE